MKVGILICTCNRPEYLRKCLESIKRNDIPHDAIILVVDDGSVDVETINLIYSTGYWVVKKAERKGIKDSLLIGFGLLFERGCDIVMNFDSDAVLSNIAVDSIYKLKVLYPARIVTGFHSTTKNANGSERHIILSDLHEAYEKKSVGGINMCMDFKLYEKYVKPALEKPFGNWDFIASINALNAGQPIISVKNSVIEHIGHTSSMGHTGGAELPDTATGFKLLTLPQVTLIGVDCVSIDRLIKAANVSVNDISFSDVKLLSSVPSPDNRVIKIRNITGKADYSQFMMKEVVDYVSTSHFLVIQYDGFVLNAEAWSNQWLLYDYIGAPWEWYDKYKVGNGGFSLRTRHLHEIIKNDDALVPVNEPGVTRFKEEDHCICRLYRRYLEDTYKIKYAPIEEARKFSIEGWQSPNRVWDGEFGFHGHHADISKSKQMI